MITCKIPVTKARVIVFGYTLKGADCLFGVYLVGLVIWLATFILHCFLLRKILLLSMFSSSIVIVPLTWQLLHSPTLRTRFGARQTLMAL